MDGFLPQFIALTWRAFLLLFVLIGFTIFFAWRTRKLAREELERKKEAIGLENDTKQKQPKKRQPKAQSASQPEPATIIEDEPVFFEAGPTSIFDDEELFGDDEPLVTTPAGDDPLADLYAARAEARQEDEDDSVDLASLLVSMVEEPKDYHLITDETVGVRLATKSIASATELLSIMRDERDARLLVQIGDTGYRTLENDLNAKKTFAKIMKELSSTVMTADDNPPDSVGTEGLSPNKMASSPVDVKISSGGDTQAREMISILRDSADGHLIVQIGNTGYRTLNGHDKAKTGFAKIMKELSQAVTTPDDNPPAVPQKPKPAPPIVERKTKDDGDDDEILPGDIRLPSMDDMPAAYEVGRFGQVRAKKVKIEDKVGELNIAEAIDAYLQYKISSAPEFQGRGIRIWSAFGGGVRIEVDGNKYEFVDEVEDPRAREFIQTAISEWQDRH